MGGISTQSAFPGDSTFSQTNNNYYIPHIRECALNSESVLPWISVLQSRASNRDHPTKFLTSF